MFNVLNDFERVQFIVYFTVTAVVLPVIGMILFKKLELVKSHEMESRYERIGPLILTSLLYCWLSWNFYRAGGQVPLPMTLVTVGATLGLFMAFFFNNFSKISLHGVGMGGMVTAMIIVAYNWSYGYILMPGNTAIHMIIMIIILLIITGLVMSSRLILGAHNLGQVYHGLLVGVLGQLIALRIFL